jgi:hypothetical protein
VIAMIATERGTNQTHLYRVTGSSGSELADSELENLTFELDKLDVDYLLVDTRHGKSPGQRGVLMSLPGDDIQDAMAASRRANVNLSPCRLP